MTRNDPDQLPVALPAELKALLERGHAGDESVLLQIQQAFDEHPELVEKLGDLARHAEQSILNLIAGPSLTGREAVARHADGVRQELLATNASPLERLLVERVVLSWMWAHQADCELAMRLRQPAPTSGLVREALNRLDRAQARFLAAAKGLALVRKLAPKTVSLVDVLNLPVPERPLPARKRPPGRRGELALKT